MQSVRGRGTCVERGQGTRSRDNLLRSKHLLANTWLLWRPGSGFSTDATTRITILNDIYACLLFWQRRFGDWVLPASTGEMYSAGSNICLRTPAITVVGCQCCWHCKPLCIVAGVQNRRITLSVWAQLSGFHPKTETGSSFRNIVFQVKYRTIGNIQNCDSYTASSQTYGSCFRLKLCSMQFTIVERNHTKRRNVDISLLKIWVPLSPEVTCVR